jgi:hypothetical protein
LFACPRCASRGRRAYLLMRSVLVVRVGKPLSFTGASPPLLSGRPRPGTSGSICSGDSRSKRVPWPVLSVNRFIERPPTALQIGKRQASHMLLEVWCRHVGLVSCCVDVLLEEKKTIAGRLGSVAPESTDNPVQVAREGSSSLSPARSSLPAPFLRARVLPQRTPLSSSSFLAYTLTEYSYACNFHLHDFPSFSKRSCFKAEPGPSSPTRRRLNKHNIARLEPARVPGESLVAIHSLA